MTRVPQMKDVVKTPKGDGDVVARAETPGEWRIGVRLKSGELWTGSEKETELIEAAGEGEFLAQLEKEQSKDEKVARKKPKKT